MAIVRIGIETNGVVHGHNTVALMPLGRHPGEVFATFRALVFPTFSIYAREEEAD